METKMTLEEHQERKGRSYKLLLLFGMISIFMIFAGLTSAFIVSKSRPDWLDGFILPSAFLFSTLTMLLSSLTFYLAYIATKENQRSKASLMLWVTLALGFLFVYLQFKGFQQVVEDGHYFTGSESNITTTFLYIIVLVHLAHLIGGFISLLIVIYNHYKQKYSATQTLGIELSAMYWHFMDFIWVCLFLFFYFSK
jgi:cytochrome c oxidase subunit 3